MYKGYECKAYFLFFVDLYSTYQCRRFQVLGTGFPRFARTTFFYE